MRPTPAFLRAAACCGLVLTASAAFAEPRIANGASPFTAAAAIGSERLATTRGGADVVDNRVRNDGAVTNTSASHVVTGANLITDGSFANAAGLSTVIQNSGANVLIQNATIVNVQFK